MSQEDFSASRRRIRSCHVYDRGKLLAPDNVSARYIQTHATSRPTTNEPARSAGAVLVRQYAVICLGDIWATRREPPRARHRRGRGESACSDSRYWLRWSPAAGMTMDDVWCLECTRSSCSDVNALRQRSTTVLIARYFHEGVPRPRVSSAPGRCCSARASRLQGIAV
jgi:hypothetical protein